MTSRSNQASRAVLALIVRQWLKEWEEVPWNAERHQGKPEKKHFYLFSLPASTLRSLSDIQIRTTKDRTPRAADLGPQRFHERERSAEIARFVRYGFPWSNISEAKRQSGEFEDLRKPGWLPTAIVVNIVPPGDSRAGRVLKPEHAIRIEDREDGTALLHLPENERDLSDLAPVEVIDGQHRLWAFDEDVNGDDFDLPVVAFDGLDHSWQAYLFWTINIKPKRINASLAFDLYPLLRTEDWLEKFEGHSIYRETRAQELVEALWFHDLSPWRDRINMLGEPSKQLGTKVPMVSQSAWVRSLTATYIRAWESPRGKGMGGLFGAPIGGNETVLQWDRAQQAAFLIFVWRELERAVASNQTHWAVSVREAASAKSKKQDESNVHDAAFASEYSLLATDQGVRGVLYASNDLCYVWSDKLDLTGWAESATSAATDQGAVSALLKSLEDETFAPFIRQMASALAGFDWRSPTTPGMSPEARRNQSVYRGSGGYALLRQDLLKRLGGAGGSIAEAAAEAQNRLGY